MQLIDVELDSKRWLFLQLYRFKKLVAGIQLYRVICTLAK